LDGFSGAFYHRPPSFLLQESGIDGFNLRSIVVLKEDAPILLLPLFETRFDLSTFVEGWIKKSLKVAGRLIPRFFNPCFKRGLLVGNGVKSGLILTSMRAPSRQHSKWPLAPCKRSRPDLKATLWALQL